MPHLAFLCSQFAGIAFLRLLSFFGFDQGLCDDRIKLFDAIFLVSSLVPESIAHHHEFARFVQFQFRKQPHPLVIGDREAFVQIPFQHGLAVHLVDVLPSGAGTTGERKAEFGIGDGWRFDHVSIIPTALGFASSFRKTASG